MNHKNVRTQIIISERNRILLEKDGRFKDRKVSDLINKLISEHYEKPNSNHRSTDNSELVELVRFLIAENETNIKLQKVILKEVIQASTILSSTVSTDTQAIASKKAIQRLHKLLLEDEYDVNEDEEKIEEVIEEKIEEETKEPSPKFSFDLTKLKRGGE